MTVYIDRYDVFPSKPIGPKITSVTFFAKSQNDSLFRKIINVYKYIHVIIFASYDFMSK